jgi:predicted RNA binding protein YcfA (HicA-like mRNA interferase family)
LNTQPATVGELIRHEVDRPALVDGAWDEHRDRGMQTWDQIKGITKDDLIKALERDGWTLDDPKGDSMRIYYKAPNRRVSIHYHAGATMGRNLLNALMDDIGWTDSDL